MSTPKKKPARKAKPARKGINPNARLFNPSEPINLDEAWARAQTEDKDPEKARITVAALRRSFEAVKAACESKPAKKPAAHPIPPSPPMIRLRLPSEKPTREDGDEDGFIFTIYACTGGKKDSLRWLWDQPFEGDELAWFSLPDGILPREPSQEERWQQEFSEWWTNTGHTDHNGLIADAAWQGFLAAKKGGAE
jgi:hypothetical protein